MPIACHLQGFKVLLCSSLSCVVTVIIMAQICTVPPTALDGSTSQVEKAKAIIQYKITE